MGKVVYSLGKSSRERLMLVHPNLVRVVERAIVLTKQDFTVLEGLRTEAMQREYVRTGVSHTMDSKHLLQPDGFAHAVDLVPWINGKPRWEWPAIYPIAEAVRQAAAEQGCKIRWGGHWGRLDNTCFRPVEELVEEYVDLRRKVKLKAFVDGPHYELV